MKRYILDTNAIGDLINHRNGVDRRGKAARTAGHRVGTCGPVLGEFYYGLELSASRDENFRRDRPVIKALVQWPFGDDAGLEFGRLRALLRRIGRQMQIPDVQLAAIAFTLGSCTVVSADSDLSAIPGLTVENWAAP